MLDWIAPRTPDTIMPIPWMHPSAVSYLGEILRPDFWVLEHGSGGSTLWLAERVACVVSVEHDPAWREAVRKLAPTNVTLVTAMDYPANKFDLLLIDGERDKRGDYLMVAHKIVKPGGWVVLDNANRPEYKEQRQFFSEHAELVERFNNNIHSSKYFVTEFWKCE